MMRMLPDPDAVPAGWSTRLSTEQLRFYFLHQMNPADPDVYICRVVRVRGLLDAALVRASVLDLARRHDVLRSYYPAGDGRPQIWLRDEVDAAVVLRDVSPDEAEAAIEAELAIAEPFALEAGPLFRVTILRLAADHHVIVVRFHHIVLDGTSVRMFLDGLWETYAGKRNERPAHQFDEFVDWEGRRAVDRDHWARKLARPTVLDLTLGVARPERHTRAAGSVHLQASPTLVAALRGACRALHVTPYMVMTAVFQVLLHALTGKQDVLLATPIACRPRVAMQTMLGVLVNWIAFRGELRPELTFEELLAHIRGELPEAYARQCSYEALLSAAGHIPREPARNPLFQVTLNYATFKPHVPPAGLAIELDPIVTRQTHYDLAVRFEEVGDTLALGLTYYRGAVSPAAAEQLATGLLALAERCLAEPRASIAQLRTTVPLAAPRVVIAATFTAEPIVPTLEFWLDRIGLRAAIELAPFGQVFQALLHPAGVTVVLVRFEDWKDPAAGVAQLCELLERAPGETIVVICPPSAAERAADHTDPLERAIERVAETSPRVHAVSWRAILACYPVDELDDPDADAYASAPYAQDFTTALGTAIARKLHAVLRPPPKVLVLDCDNTLWRGVVGEDGPDGIVVDAAHAKLQRFAAAQREAGVLLALVSKNAEPDVWEAFDRTPGMVLRKDQIVAHRINWDAKSANLASLARELNLGSDSFVFIDDSPAECAEVRAACPGVLVLQLPGGDGIPAFLDHLWPLDPRKVTATDRQRAALYAANAQREQLRTTVSDPHAFIEFLGVTVTFLALTTATAARAAQLTQRTNQFNTTTIRRSETELSALVARGYEVLIAEVTDRFGDYGVVGVAVYRVGAVLAVESLLLSCRALGRGVEHRILAELGRIAAARGVAEIELGFAPTAKNQPARAFLDRVATPFAGGYRLTVAAAFAATEMGIGNAPGTAIALDAGIGTTALAAGIGTATALDTAIATPGLGASIETAPATDTSIATAPATDSGIATGLAHETGVALAPAPTMAADLWCDVATELATVPQIRAAIRTARGRTRSATHPFDPPRDELEIAIARIWSSVLLVEPIGARDDYFAIGGDSIKSLAVVSALRRAGLPVTVLDIHQHPTVAELADLVRHRTPPAPAPVPEPATGPYPLAFSQRYILAAYAAENLTGNPTGAFHVQDRIALHARRAAHSLPALRRAVELVVQRTPVLRSQIRGGLQVELDARPAFEVIDVAALPPARQDAAIEAVMRDDRARPFDPERATGPMIRFYAVVRGPRDIELIVTAHHAFCDGWSLQNFYNQLFALYRDPAHEVPQTGGFRELVAREQLAAQHPAFWRSYLASRPFTPGRRAGGYQQRLIVGADWKLVEAASARARASRTSLKAVLLEAFAAQLGAGPRLVAVVANGRKDDLSAPTEVFGLCWTFVPIVTGGGLRRLHEDLLATEAHARHPVEAMFGGCDPAAVAHASFNFTNFHNATWRSGTTDLEVTQAESFHRFHFAINFNIRLVEPTRTVALKLTWAKDRFDAADARGILAGFVAGFEAD